MYMSQNKILIIVLVVIFGVGGYFILRKPPVKVDKPVMGNPELNPPVEGKLNGNPTDFAQAGFITFKTPDPDIHGTPYFTYTVATTTGITATTTLVFDPLSFCVRSNGGTPCIALSSTYDMIFKDKKVIVEGIRLAENNEVLVRKLYVLQEGEEPRVPAIGQLFITWPQAESIIRACGVKMVMQTHAHDVYLTMKDDTILRTVPPMMDDVFRVVGETKEECGDIAQAIE
jgi:hypothetical protein